MIVSLALLAWRRPVFFKLGLRPIPRRRAQSTLIVLGLMLATLIITAAFVTGDTLSHTIRTEAIEGMGEMDEVVQVGGGSAVSSYFKMARLRVPGGAAGRLPAGGPSPARHQRVGAGSERHPPPQPAQHRGHGAAPGDVRVLPQEEIPTPPASRWRWRPWGRTRSISTPRQPKPWRRRPATCWSCTSAPIPKFTPSAPSPPRGRSTPAAQPSPGPGIFNQRGKINLIVVSNQGDALGGAAHSQEVTATCAAC